MEADEADDRKLNADRAFEALKDIFSQLKGPTKDNGRRYFLEFIDGQPVFRPDELDFAFAKVFNEVCRNGVRDDGEDEIVPRKLAMQFPHRSY